MTDPIYFGGVNLLTVSGLTIAGYDPFRYPERRVTTNSVSTFDLSVTSSANFSGRPVNVRGIIARTSRELLDESIHELNRILKPIKQDLKMPIRGQQMLLKSVTVQNIAYKDVVGGYIQVDIEFFADDPVIYALTETAVLAVSNLTSGIKSYPITFEGSDNQWPRITFTLDSFTGTLNRAITFENPATETSITIERSWTAGEIVVINCEPGNQYVTVNGSAVDFSGNFPYWATGAGFLNYTDNFTARQVDISLHYTKRYF